MALCLFIANSAYYANKLGQSSMENAATSKILAYRSWLLRFWKKGKA